MKFIQPIVCLLIVLTAHNALATHHPPKSKLKTVYGYHLRAAQGFGLPAIKNNKQMAKLITRHQLSKTFCKKGCTIYKLAYSKPYMVPKANKVMNEISKTFNKNTGATFTITSLTRSMGAQHLLTRTNANARKNLSSHNYGASFDVSYVRFNNKLGANPKLEQALYRVLNYYANTGKIFFIREYQQKCYHITVRS